MATTDLTTNLKALAAAWKSVDAMLSSKADVSVQRAQDMSAALQELITQASAVKSGIDIAVSARTAPPKPDVMPTDVVAVFKTAKGSTYYVQSNGKTLRDKAYRPEHGVAEQGIQPLSERTVYVDKEGLLALSEFQRQMNHKKRIVFFDQQRIGIQLLSGELEGKFRSVTPYSVSPEVGLTPVELWNNGNRVHFGNTIVEVTQVADVGRKLSDDSGGAIATMRGAISACEKRLSGQLNQQPALTQSNVGSNMSRPR